MSVLVGFNTRLVVQGMSGSAGAFHAKQMVEYGTNVVAGVVPGKGGSKVAGLEQIPMSAAGAASAHGGIADILIKKPTERKRALDEHRAAEREVAVLVAKDPNDTRWQQGRAAMQSRIGGDLLELNDPQAAVKELEIALEQYQALVAKNAKNVDWANGVVATRSDLVHAYVEMRDWNGTLAHAKLAEDSMAAQRPSVGDDPGLADMEAELHEWMADAYVGLHDPVHARAEYKVALDYARKVLAVVPKDPDINSRVARLTAKSR